MTTGAERIHRERDRQILDEGFGAADDDGYVDHELLYAAQAYTTAGLLAEAGLLQVGAVPPSPWPKTWDKSWWKPSESPIDNLVKAGALIAAEIDRLQRADREADCG